MEVHPVLARSKIFKFKASAAVVNLAFLEAAARVRGGVQLHHDHAVAGVAHAAGDSAIRLAFRAHIRHREAIHGHRFFCGRRRGRRRLFVADSDRRGILDALIVQAEVHPVFPCGQAGKAVASAAVADFLLANPVARAGVQLDDRDRFAGVAHAAVDFAIQGRLRAGVLSACGHAGELRFRRCRGFGRRPLIITDSDRRGILDALIVQAEIHPVFPCGQAGEAVASAAVADFLLADPVARSGVQLDYRDRFAGVAHAAVDFAIQGRLRAGVLSACGHAGELRFRRCRGFGRRPLIITDSDRRGILDALIVQAEIHPVFPCGQAGEAVASAAVADFLLADPVARAGVQLDDRDRFPAVAHAAGDCAVSFRLRAGVLSAGGHAGELVFGFNRPGLRLAGRRLPLCQRGKGHAAAEHRQRQCCRDLSLHVISLHGNPLRASFSNRFASSYHVLFDYATAARFMIFLVT